MANDAADRKNMIAIRHGDFEAFEHVYHQYYRRMYSFFYRLCWDSAYAEDLLQETFIRLWKGAKFFDTKRPLAPYLYRIGKNTWIDNERLKGHIKTNTIESSSSTDSSLVSDAAADVTKRVAKAHTALMGEGQDGVAADERDAPQAQAQKRELEDEVHSALEGLDADKRLVVVLCFYQGLRLQEIADILEIPLGTVKSRLFHAERHLRGRLQHLVS